MTFDKIMGSNFHVPSAMTERVLSRANSKGLKKKQIGHTTNNSREHIKVATGHGSQDFQMANHQDNMISKVHTERNKKIDEMTKGEQQAKVLN